jgi:hypothetical protein
MAKKIINVNTPNDFINTGTAANARDGDSLRSSFARLNDAIDDIDSNFAELYATSPVTFPSQTGNTGKYLKTNGTTLSWATVTVPTDINQLADSSNLLTSIEAKVTIGATAPTGVVGRLWYDTISGRMYIYYSGAWVDANP